MGPREFSIDSREVLSGSVWPLSLGELVQLTFPERNRGASFESNEYHRSRL